MNRQHRRIQAKSRGINRDALKREIAEAVTRKTEQAMNDGRVEAMMLCFVLALHQEFGYGKKRCLQALEAVDGLMGPWVEGADTIDGLKDKVLQDVGIKIEC